MENNDALKIEKNDRYTLEITDMNQEGQGIARIRNVVAFVDGALPGEKVDAVIIKTASNYVIAKTLGFIDKSTERVEPFCGSYSQCGGCTLQHLSYAAQLKYKSRQVEETLRRIGGFSDVKVEPTVGMDDYLRYRNKAQFPVAGDPMSEEPAPSPPSKKARTADRKNIGYAFKKDKDRYEGGIQIGFYAPRTHTIIDGAECPINDKNADTVREIVRKHMMKHGIRPYDEKTHIGLVRHVIIRTAPGTGEVMVIIVANGKDLPAARELASKLAAGIGGFKSLYLNINTKDTNVITGSQSLLLNGETHITDIMDGFKFKISPLSFYQVNTSQTRKMYKRIVELAGLLGNETVLDLYCGIGTISLFLARRAKTVIGVESVREAVDTAKLNARINQIENVAFIAGDALKEVSRMNAEGMRPDVAVIDPPRAGCEPELMRALGEMRPERIIYVSCKASTLARDLKLIAEYGYVIKTVQPFDMFPQTGHVETVVYLYRKNTDE